MNNASLDKFEDRETDAMLRQLFNEADKLRISQNLAERAMRLARNPTSDSANASARFVRRCVTVMNLGGIGVIALILWKGLPMIWSALESIDSTTTSTTTTPSTFALTSTLEIILAVLLLFAAAGTQWAFRAPANAPGLLPIGNA